MIDSKGIEYVFVYHCCYIVNSENGGLANGDLIIEIPESIYHDPQAIEGIRQNILAYARRKNAGVVITGIVFEQTPQLLQTRFFKDGKPYEPPVEESKALPKGLPKWNG